MAAQLRPAKQQGTVILIRNYKCNMESFGNTNFFIDKMTFYQSDFFPSVIRSNHFIKRQQ